MSRDMQRQKLYNAENEVFDAHSGEDNRYTPYTLGDYDFAATVAFVKYVTESAYFRRKYGPLDVIVKDGRACRWATARGHSTIVLPRWARNKCIVLHEIAHLVNKEERRNGAASHGWQFAAIYLDLVRHFLGKEDEARLKAAFRKYKVRWRPKAKRNLSEEQRAVLRERMAKARAARA